MTYFKFAVKLLFDTFSITNFNLTDIFNIQDGSETFQLEGTEKDRETA